MSKFKKEQLYPLVEQGFIFRDVGSKTNYGVFHKDINNGETLVCWMSKPIVKKEDLEKKKYELYLDDKLEYRLKDIEVDILKG